MVLYVFQEEIKIVGCQIFVNPYDEAKEQVNYFSFVSIHSQPSGVLKLVC